jgi:beta-propeller repeat-containing protein
MSGDQFPATPGAFQTNCVFSICGFVTELNASGSALVYSTLLGGNGNSYAHVNAIAVDANGDAFVTGRTGGGFPTTPGAFQTTYAGGPALADMTPLCRS